MKKIISTVAAILLLVSVLAFSATAATVYEQNLERDFSSGQYSISVGDAISDVVLSYNDDPMAFGPVAGTSITMPSGAAGRVFTGLFYHSINAVSSDSNDVVNGKISCQAVLYDANMATKANHYANRVYSGDAVLWNYYVIDPRHNPNQTDY